MLSAKRIPIHPAMVRYLVAHEYGHAAFHHVARLMGYLDGERDRLEAKYIAEVRGADLSPPKYSGGRWHRAFGEIIANDFRVAVMGREAEFWPHDLPRPVVGDSVEAWWGKARQLAARVSAPASVSAP